MSAPSAEAPPLALTVGEPSGVGPDIAALAFARRVEYGLSPFFLIADPAMMRDRLDRLRIEAPLQAIDRPAEARSVFGSALPVLPLVNRHAEVPGRLDPANAAGTVEAIDRAVALVTTGEAAAIVTNPIDKRALYDAGFRHPGHTEYLAELCRSPDGAPPTPVMLLTGPDLSCVPVTIHIPLSEVPSRLTRALIVETGRIVAQDMAKWMGVPSPRLAVSGLNPHAGERGAIGSEDDAVIRPAVEELRSAGIDAFGPLPADTMFHAEARRRYDVALCMYHDQALIPAKTLAFDETVNVTLGLPIIRTSPDHGTAADIAGTGKARPDSLVAALRLAGRMAGHRSASLAADSTAP